MLHSAVTSRYPTQSLHVPGAPATRYDGVDARHGMADQRSQNQTGEKENEPDKRKTISLQEVYTTYFAAGTCILPLF